MKIQFTFAALFAALLVSAPVRAQEPVVAASDPDALFHSKDKKLDRNKQAAYHIEKDLLEAGAKWSKEFSDAEFVSVSVQAKDKVKVAFVNA